MTSGWGGGGSRLLCFKSLLEKMVQCAHTCPHTLQPLAAVIFHTSFHHLFPESLGKEKYVFFLYTYMYVMECSTEFLFWRSGGEVRRCGRGVVVAQEGELTIAIHTFYVFLIKILAKPLVGRGEEVEPAAFNPQRTYTGRHLTSSYYSSLIGENPHSFFLIG
jgi:hypothetical protein